MKDSWETVARLKEAAMGHAGIRDNLSRALAGKAHAMADRLLSRHAEPAVAVPEMTQACSYTIVCIKPYQRSAIEWLRGRAPIVVPANLGKAGR